MEAASAAGIAPGALVASVAGIAPADSAACTVREGSAEPIMGRAWAVRARPDSAAPDWAEPRAVLVRADSVSEAAGPMARAIASRPPLGASSTASLGCRPMADTTSAPAAAVWASAAILVLAAVDLALEPAVLVGRASASVAWAGRGLVLEEWADRALEPAVLVGRASASVALAGRGLVLEEWADRALELAAWVSTAFRLPYATGTPLPFEAASIVGTSTVEAGTPVTLGRGARPGGAWARPHGRQRPGTPWATG